METIIYWYMTFGISFNNILAFFGSIIGSCIAGSIAIILWKIQVIKEEKEKHRENKLNELNYIIDEILCIQNDNNLLIKQSYLIKLINNFLEIIKDDYTLLNTIKTKMIKISYNGYYKSIFECDIIDYFVLNIGESFGEFIDAVQYNIKDGRIKKQTFKKEYNDDFPCGIYDNFKKLFEFECLLNGYQQNINLLNYLTKNTDDRENYYYNNLYGYLDITGQLDSILK